MTCLDGANGPNPQPARELSVGGLTLGTGDGTDIWRDTLHGFRRDSGHAHLSPANGDFTAHVSFDGDYGALHDEAGIAFSDGVANLSVVVTRGASDWSSLAPGPAPGPQRLRLTRTGGAVAIHARNAANRWKLPRVTSFTEGPALIGPMACSPERAGFRARFFEFTPGPATAKALHDESPAS